MGKIKHWNGCKNNVSGGKTHSYELVNLIVTVLLCHRFAFRSVFVLTTN